MALVAEVGPQAFTLREVARRAGVSHNAPYRHFQDKDELLAAVAAQGFGKLTAAMREEAAAGATGLERWRLSGRGYIGFALRWPEHFAVMFEARFDASRYVECKAAGEAAFQTLVGYIREAQAEGGMAGGDPRPLALVSWAGVHGLAKLAIGGRLPIGAEQALAFFDGYASEAMLTGMSAKVGG